jgi:hypothetical protein
VLNATLFEVEELPLVISPLEAAQQAKQLIELKAGSPGRRDGCDGCEGGKKHGKRMGICQNHGGVLPVLPEFRLVGSTVIGDDSL